MPATAPADGQTAGDTTENAGEGLTEQCTEPKKLVSKQGARNLTAVWDDLVTHKFLLLHSPPLLAFTIDCLNKFFSI